MQPANPFTWASGWRSPIYCDNRQTISYPEIRNKICDAFVEKIKEEYPNAEIIAGVATGAIAIGMLVADRMGLPFIYIRSAAKGHGLTNLIEGKLEKNNNVVVIEDLISTGGSSLKAVEAVREAGANVLGLLAIFTYGFQKSIDAFTEKNCEFDTLSNYEAMLQQAANSGYIAASELDVLKEWSKDPANWGV